MSEEEKKPETLTAKELMIMAKALEEMQVNLEPIRDRALDEKARLTGYSQCAEQMIKIIVARMMALKTDAETLLKEELKPKEKQPEEEQKRGKKKTPPQGE